MKVDAISREQQPHLYRYIAKRYGQAEAVITQLVAPTEALDISERDVVNLTPEAIAAMDSVAAAEADWQAWRAGTIRDDLYARWRAIDAGRLIGVPESTIEIEYLTSLDRTGMRTPFLWRAREGARARGVILAITDQLRPNLQPPADDAELWAAVVQLAMPKLRAAVHDVEAFFATTEDLEIVLHVNEVDPAWERGRRFSTL